MKRETRAQLVREVNKLRALLSRNVVTWCGISAPTVDALRNLVQERAPTADWTCPRCMTKHKGPVALHAHQLKCYAEEL